MLFQDVSRLQADADSDQEYLGIYAGSDPDRGRILSVTATVLRQTILWAMYTR